MGLLGTRSLQHHALASLSGKEKTKARGTWKVQKRGQRATKKDGGRSRNLWLEGSEGAQAVLPLLSTLPTNSTCLSQSDPCE